MPIKPLPKIKTSSGVRIHITENEDFETQDGVYYVNSVEVFSKTDDIYEYRETGGVLKVWLRLLDGQGKGPAMSVTPQEFLWLILAFGGEPPRFEKHEYYTSEFIQACEKAINNAEGEITVESKDGWAQFWKLTLGPNGPFVIRFKDGRRPDRSDGLHFQPSAKHPDRAPNLILEFEVVADQAGEWTPWEGFEVITWMRPSFAEVGYDEDDNEVPLQEPMLKVTKDRETSELRYYADGHRWVNFIHYFCPEVEKDWQWNSDPNDSPFGVNEITQPQYVWINLAKKYRDKHTALVFMDGSGKIDLKSAVSESPTLKIEETPKSTPKKPETKKAPVVGLCEWIKTSWPEGGSFFEGEITEQTINLTSTGKEWARSTLSGPSGAFQAAGVDPSYNRLTGLTDQQIEKLRFVLEGMISPGLDNVEEAGW